MSLRSIASEDARGVVSGDTVNKSPGRPTINLSRPACVIGCGAAALVITIGIVVAVLFATGVVGACGKDIPPDTYDFAADTNGDGVTCAKHEYGAGCFGINVACGSIDVRADGPALAEPTEVASTGGALTVSLTVEEYRLDTSEFAINARAFCLDGDCSPVGPTLRFKPGDTVSVTVTNNLPAEGAAQATKTMNQIRDLNHINIHTHGLHVDPSVDNVFVHTAPQGGSHTYEYSIGADHMPGTHWYHSHVHGASSLHVAGGLLGGIIVDHPDDASLPAAYTAMDSRLLVFSHVPLCSCNPTDDPFRIVSIQEMRYYGDDVQELNAEVGPNGITDVMLTNGQYQPQLSLAPGQWMRFETVNAVGDVFLEIEVRTGVSLGHSACSMRLLALDGVSLTAGPRDAAYVALSPGARASIAVMCDTAGTYYLQTVGGGRAADAEAEFRQNLLTLHVAGGAVSMTEPAWGADAMARPDYLRDMRDLGSGNAAAATWEMGVEQGGVTGGGAWLGVGTDCSLEAGGRDAGGDVDANSYGQCPYVAFGGPAMEYRQVAKVCDVVDVTLQGRGATPHPMHIHVNHFQVVAMNVAGGPEIEDVWGAVGDFRDTFPALTGSVTLRYVAADYGGVVVSHCHFLWHEDLGMMQRGWLAAEDDASVARCTASGVQGSRVLCDAGLPDDAYADAPAPVVSSCAAGFTVKRSDGSYGKVDLSA